MEGKEGLWHGVPCAGCKCEDVLVIPDQKG